MLVAVMVSASFPVYAAETKPTGRWSPDYNWNGSSVFSVEKDGGFSKNPSITIDNTDFNDAFFSLTLPAEPDTFYRLTAMVKYEGYEDNDAPSGASIGISGSFQRSAYCAEDEWTPLSFEFHSLDQSEISFCLRNGMYGGTCKGKAYFTDIQIEKASAVPTTAWNVLVVVFKQVNVPSVVRDSLNNADVRYLTGVVENIKDSFSSISGGLMFVENIDVFASDTPVTSISTGNYSLDSGINDVLDEYLQQGDYDQIIAVAPLNKVANGWAGLGGTFYQKYGFAQVTYESGADYPGWFKPFPDALFVHEMLHCIETKSKEIDPETADLHGNSLFGFNNGSDEWRAWYTAYMRDDLRGGKGLDPRAYTVYHRGEEYTAVMDGMEVDIRSN